MQIAQLTIEMAANVARLQQDLQAARGSVDSTFASIGSSVAKLKALVGTVFAGIAVGELIGAVEKVKTAAVDIERIAAASGASLDAFQRAAAGAKTVGVNIEKFGDIMKDTQDKLGDFLITGGGELKDFFETIGPKVGVTAESFRNLSGPQALQLFYTSLEKANVGQKVMIQQMESIANDASMLAPLLANGGAEFKRLGDEAAKAGALMSSELIYASKALGEEMMRMDTVTVGISNTIMAELIPAITEMAAASREDLSAGFEAVSAWVQDNKEHLLGAWEITKAIGAEVWSVVKVAIELAVGIGKWAVESGFLEASLITIGVLVAGFKDGVDIVGAAFAKLGSIILNAVAKPMSGFLNDVGVVLKWAGQGELAGVFMDAAQGIKTAGEAGAQYAAGVASKFAAGDTAVARFTASLGASTQAAQAAAKSTYTAYQALGTGAGVSAKAAEEAKKSAEKAAAAMQKLIEDGAKLTASLLASDSGLSGDFAEKWEKLNAARRAGLTTLEELTQAQAALLAQQPAMKADADAQKKALEEQAQAWADVRSHMLAYGRAQEQAAQSVVDGNQSLRDEIELIGLSSKERTAVLQQRNREIILIKQATLAEMERANNAKQHMSREQIALAADIEALQERNELLGAQEARESWSGFWESVNSTAHDTFVNVATEGMDAFKRIGKTLKSAVLDMLYQMTIKKWIIGISGSLTGALTGGVAQAATGGSGVGSALSGVSTIGSLASGVGLLGAGGLGLQAGFGALMSGGFAGIGAAVSGGLAAIGTGVGSSIAAGLGTIAGALGPIALGAAVLWQPLFGRKLKDSGIEGTFGGAAGFEGNSYQFLKGGFFRSDKTKRGELDAGVQDYLSQSFKQLQAQTGAFADALGLQADKLTGFTSTIKLSLKDLSEQEVQAKLQEALQDTNNQLAGAILGSWEVAVNEAVSDWRAGLTGGLFAGSAQGSKETMRYVPSEFAREGEQAADTLARLATSLSAANQAFDLLGTTLLSVSLSSADAASRFIDLFGGLENFSAAMGSYYEAYYSEAERMGKVTEALTAELSKAGVEMPASKEAYRALVTEALNAGESGQALAAKLLQLNGVFAEVTDYAEQAAQAQAEAAAAIAKAQRGQDIQLLELLGDASGALAARRADELEAMDPLLREMHVYLTAIDDLSSALSKNKAELDRLQQGLEGLTGTAAKTVQQVLGDLMGRLQATSSFRTGLASSIEDARLSGMDAPGKVSYLQDKERGLWSALDGADDPTAIAAQLQQTILDRIGIEAAMRETVEQKTLDGLRAQLSVVQSMRDAVAGMQSAVDGLRLGAMSALNPYEQLQYAEGKFDAAYAKAQGGDMDAWKDVQSYGQSYVQLGRDNYASSTDSADIFFKVTEAMDQLIGLGLDVDPQITALNTQIGLLETVDQSGKANAYASEQQVIQLTNLDNRMAQVQERQQAAVDKQLALAQQQIDELRKSNELLQAQIEQQAAMARESREIQQAQSKELAALSDSARMAEAAV